MPYYFRSWKRKLGILTLAMACIFAAGWVRSLYVTDSLSIMASPWFPEVVSVDSAILADIAYIEIPKRLQLIPTWSTGEFETIKSRYFDNQYYCWQVQNGFGVGIGFGFWDRPDMTELRPDTILCVIPYWSLVLPLTLIPAWLLLSKPPRRPKGSAPPSA